jgi:hypothetical protein
MSFKQAILDQDLYASFVSSSEWISCLDKIREISPAVADAINKYGIGESICDDEPYAGQYEFESGQLLDCIPSSVKRDLEKEAEQCYDKICALAKAYANYVVENAKEISQ